MTYKKQKAHAKAWVCPSPDGIRAVIEKIGESQDAIAAKLDIHRRTVARWLSGEGKIKYTDWVCLCYLAGNGFLIEKIETKNGAQKHKA